MSTARGQFIHGAWVEGKGASISRDDPATGTTTWQGAAADGDQVDQAVAAARAALPGWSRLPLEQRVTALDAFSKAVAAQREELLKAICAETGRPKWEVKTECDALINKVELTKKAMNERRGNVELSKDGLTSATRYKPLGVAAVFGPFNLPAHLPNGHIVPALLAGNTVVFKPSELTPLVGELYTRCWEAGALPAGVFNVVQGGREVGKMLAGHAGVDAVLFTGSRAGGVAISKMLAAHPEKMLALEMGGNNPLFATRVGDVDAAALTIVQSAFMTAGQRCTCARRLILLNDAEGDQILSRTSQLAGKLRVGPPSMSPEAFMGPVISEAAAASLLRSYEELITRGGKEVLPLRTLGPATLLSPAIVEVTGVKGIPDEELFGPVLQVIRVPTIEAALAAANETAFGLAAALLSQDAELYRRFFDAVRAGIINWNRPTNGASSALPFGGMGASGNHRPAGSFSVDYCNDPVASLESPSLSMPTVLPPGIVL